MTATSLLDHDVYLVSVVHLESLWGIVVLDALAIEYEATLVVAEALALAISLHQLLQLRRLLDLEEDL